MTDALGTQTFWNGEPCTARRCFAIVADDPRFSSDYWARPHIGTVRAVVEVRPEHPISRRTVGKNPDTGNVFYIDDEDGSGWAKVTEGRGSASRPHRSLAIAKVVEYRDDAVRAPGRRGMPT